ncbi:MAG TPA: hypothetical protein VKF32_05850, partial [Thermoanaerobaculia bacterium]|nr:hypothetical protein [Thermoanaerobaculia bacterium]
YPKDLPVGRISEIRRGGPSLFLGLPVAVAADPSHESLILVLPPVPSAQGIPEQPPAPRR